MLSTAGHFALPFMQMLYCHPQITTPTVSFLLGLCHSVCRFKQSCVLFNTFCICAPTPHLFLALKKKKKRIGKLNTGCRKSGLNILFLYFKCHAYFVHHQMEWKNVMTSKQVFQTLPPLPLVRQKDSPAPNLHHWLRQCRCVRLHEIIKKIFGGINLSILIYYCSIY